MSYISTERASNCATVNVVDIVKIDLKIQDLKQQGAGNHQQLIKALEITKEDKQRDIVNLQLELLKARRRLGGYYILGGGGFLGCWEKPPQGLILGELFNGNA